MEEGKRWWGGGRAGGGGGDGGVGGWVCGGLGGVGGCVDGGVRGECVGELAGWVGVWRWCGGGVGAHTCCFTYLPTIVNIDFDEGIPSSILKVHFDWAFLQYFNLFNGHSCNLSAFQCNTIHGKMIDNIGSYQQCVPTYATISALA